MENNDLHTVRKNIVEVLAILAKYPCRKYDSEADYRMVRIYENIRAAKGSLDKLTIELIDSEY